MKQSREQMILALIQPSLFFRRKKIIAIPLVPHFANGATTHQKEWRSAVKSNDPNAALYRVDAHLPFSRMRRAVKIPVVHQRLQLHLQRTASLNHRVLHVTRVSVLLHKHALFHPRLAQCVRPDGRPAFQPKLLNVLKSFRLNSAASPSMRSQRKLRAPMPHNFVHPCDKLRPPNRRVQRGHQQSVIPPRHPPSNRSRRISTDAVSHQPLARLRLFEIAANLAPKSYCYVGIHRPAISASTDEATEVRRPARPTRHSVRSILPPAPSTPSGDSRRYPRRCLRDNIRKTRLTPSNADHFGKCPLHTPLAAVRSSSRFRRFIVRAAHMAVQGDFIRVIGVGSRQRTYSVRRQKFRLVQHPLQDSLQLRPAHQRKQPPHPASRAL